MAMSPALTELLRPMAKRAAPSPYAVRVFTTTPNVPSAPAFVFTKPKHLIADKCNCELVATNLTQVWRNGNGGGWRRCHPDTLPEKRGKGRCRPEVAVHGNGMWLKGFTICIGGEDASRPQLRGNITRPFWRRSSRLCICILMLL